MNKHIMDEKTGISYTLQGDYYLPDFALPSEEEQPIGVWGQRHGRYLKEHKQAVYTTLVTSSKLNSYLADIDQQAEDMFLRLVKQMAENQGVNEDMKATDQMAWIRKMNNIQAAAREIVNAELVLM